VDLLAGGHDGVVFALVVYRVDLLAQVDQAVGLARHGRDHDGNLVAGLDFAFHLGGHVLHTVD
jgi:hypothetical protein